jgi:hypothetical protein
MTLNTTDTAIEASHDTDQAEECVEQTTVDEQVILENSKEVLHMICQQTRRDTNAKATPY